MRDLIKTGSSAIAPSAFEEKQEEIAHYDVDMVPESTIIYESCGAIIHTPHIETLEGKRINILSRHQEYIYTYRVEFKDNAESVRFGMLIKTKSGVELGGAATVSCNQPGEDIKAGTIRTIRFRFTCLLLPGTYFLNAGCVGKIGGEETYLHRIIDACMFKVLPEEGMTATGIIDFLTKPEVR